MEHELSIVEAGKPTYEWKFIACVPYGGRNDGDFSRPTADANARLISASPDMLAALRKFVTAAKSWHDFHHGSETVQCDWLCECIAPAEVAIAKAEGRS